MKNMECCSSAFSNVLRTFKVSWLSRDCLHPNKLGCVAEEGTRNVLPLAFLGQMEAFLIGD